MLHSLSNVVLYERPFSISTVQMCATALMQGINDRHVAAVKALAVAQAGQKALQEQAKAKQEAFVQLQDQLAQASQELSKAKQDLAAARHQIPLLSQEIKSLNVKVASQQRDLEGLQSTYDSTQRSLATCTVELEEAQEQANQLKVRLEVATHSYKKLQAANSHLQEEVQIKVRAMLILHVLQCSRLFDNYVAAPLICWAHS